jgi:capsular exopolysaccharide synthesis family protein
LPWDLGTPRSSEGPLPWDLGSPDSGVVLSAATATAATGPASVAPGPAAIVRPSPPVQVLANAMPRTIVPIRPVPSEYADKRIIASDLPPGLVEQYRRLGAALHHAQTEQGVRIIMVTSAMPAEGKTLVASNLALVLSHSYARRVLLMDGDLRRPSIHTVFGVENTSGIADRLDGDRPGALPPVQVTANLEILVAGRPQPDPLRIVTGSAMNRLIHDAAAKYDWVIMDSPPVGLLPDAHLLAAMVDKVLLVIQAGKTSYDIIQKSVSTIGKDRLIGTVLNRAEASVANPYYTQYDAYYNSPVIR